MILALLFRGGTASHVWQNLDVDVQILGPEGIC